MTSILPSARVWFSYLNHEATGTKRTSIGVS